MRTELPGLMGWECIDELVKNMRTIDEYEIRTATGFSPREGVEKSLEASDWSSFVLYDEEVAYVYGLSGNCPWLLGTHQISRHPKRFWQDSIDILGRMLEEQPVLTNYISTMNHVAIRWGEKLGFKFDDPAPYGVAQANYRKFTLDQESFQCALQSL